MRAITDLDPGSIDTAIELINAAGNVLVLTGAGISTDSGIADYRGPNGVWTKNPAAEKASHISMFVADAEHRRQRWQRLVDDPTRREPNRGHRALAAPQAAQRIGLLVTQNVDGLHLDAGSDPSRLIEIHGTVRQYKCLRCDDRGPIEPILERVRAGDHDPHCHCGGLLKAATVSFGESLDREDLLRAHQGAVDADLVVCVGTTLTVNPIAQLAPIGVANGADLLIVNDQPTAFDDLARVVLPASISAVLPVIFGVEDSLEP